MDSNLAAFAERLQTKLDAAEDQNMVLAQDELVALMDRHLDIISAGVAHASGHQSGHLSGHGSSGRELDAI
jgi:hypothetical protein